MPDAAASAHISGVVVFARPDAAARVERDIAAMPGASVEASEGGRIVVVLEAPDEQALADTVNRLTLMDDVYSASLVSHFVDHGGDAAQEPLSEGDPS